MSRTLSRTHRARISAGLKRRAQAMSVASASTISDDEEPEKNLPQYLSVDLLRNTIITNARAMISRAEEILRLVGETP